MRPDLTELVVPAVQALAGQDVLVVVTTGQATPDDLVAALGRTLPANARVARFIPYDLLLARASVFVTNGGYTGVTLALAHGVPLVQAGTTEEKVEIAARIKWSGVGVTLGSTRPSPEAIGKGVRTVLDKPTFRAAAGAIRQEMADHDAGREGAELLLRLAHTGRPVPRGETVMPGRAGRPPAQPSRIARR
jgi:UDP:flavonoid glycosyltransferase YjiC (YdhE family)